MNEIASPIQLRSKSNTSTADSSHTPMRSDCTRSSLADICLLLNISGVGTTSDRMFLRRRVKAGCWIFSSGQKFDSVFIVYSGSIKTLLIDEAGNEQILSFPLRGDLLGLDGLHARCHPSQAVALTDCELIVIPFCDLMKLTHEHLPIETWLYCAVSRALGHEHALTGVLSTLCSEARVARFLLLLSERFKKLGCSSTHFSLHMTRQEIGSYLGLSLETVSRALSALHEAQLIDISRRTVVLRNLEGLRDLKKIPSIATNHRQSIATTAALHVIKSGNATAVRRAQPTWFSLVTSL